MGKSNGEKQRGLKKLLPGQRCGLCECGPYVGKDKKNREFVPRLKTGDGLMLANPKERVVAASWFRSDVAFLQNSSSCQNNHTLMYFFYFCFCCFVLLVACLFACF